MQIEAATFKFLKDLEKNNQRDWFQANKHRYEAAIQNVRDFLATIEQGLNRKDKIEEANVFRIYRDIRFSKNKDPYKNHFGLFFKRAKPALRGGYYLHLEPGRNFVGGGFWEPNPADLKRIRDEFAFDDKPIRKIVSSKSFVKHFGNLHGDELKTAPAGYERDHPAIDLIRKKQFLVTRSFTDREVQDKNFSKEVILTYEAMRPFFDYMSEVLNTDLNGRPRLA